MMGISKTFLESNLVCPKKSNKQQTTKYINNESSVSDVSAQCTIIIIATENKNNRSNSFARAKVLVTIITTTRDIIVHKDIPNGDNKSGRTAVYAIIKTTVHTNKNE